MAGGYLLVRRGSVGTSGVVIVAAAPEKRETGGWIWRQRKRGYWRESERIEAAAVLPFSLVAVFPSCSYRLRAPATVASPATERHPPLSRLACWPPAALPRPEREKRRKRRVMTWITLTCGDHVGPTLTQPSRRLKPESKPLRDLL
uniref:Uncharacterized protein n=1 Tax=Oryza rufipogon TaxID=4529 RepID=A0A0E0MX16_ORYRU